MNDKQFARWEKQRKLGKLKFILILGTSYNVVLIFTVNFLDLIIGKSKDYSIKGFLIQIIIGEVVGSIFALVVWNISERRYRNYESEISADETINDKVKIVGIYKVQENADVHMIELEVHERSSLIDVSTFTQEIPDKPASGWQAAYDEYYLNSTGDAVIGDFISLPERDDGTTRLVFFFYYLDFKSPLLSQFGQVKLIKPIKMPDRLKNIIDFVEVD